MYTEQTAAKLNQQTCAGLTSVVETVEKLSECSMNWKCFNEKQQ